MTKTNYLTLPHIQPNHMVYMISVSSTNRVTFSYFFFIKCISWQYSIINICAVVVVLTKYEILVTRQHKTLWRKFELPAYVESQMMHLAIYTDCTD